MDKTFYLFFSGLLIVASAVVIFFSESIGLSSSKLLVPVFIAVAGLATLVFSRNNQLHSVARQYHLVQGFGLATFAAVLLGMAESLQDFLLITTYFVLLFGLFELSFGLMVLNSKHIINKKIMMVRMISGVLNLIGGFVLLMLSFQDFETGAQFAALLIAITGISLVVFSMKVRAKLANG